MISPVLSEVHRLWYPVTTSQQKRSSQGGSPQRSEKALELMDTKHVAMSGLHYAWNITLNPLTSRVNHLQSYIPVSYSHDNATPPLPAQWCPLLRLQTRVQGFAMSPQILSLPIKSILHALAPLPYHLPLEPKEAACPRHNPLILLATIWCPSSWINPSMTRLKESCRGQMQWRRMFVRYIKVQQKKTPNKTRNCRFFLVQFGCPYPYMAWSQRWMLLLSLLSLLLQCWSLLDGHVLLERVYINIYI